MNQPDTLSTRPMPLVAERQFQFAEILLIWAAAAIPMMLLAWAAAPLVIERARIPAVVVYWLTLMIGALWQIGLSLGIIRWRQGSLRPDAIRRYLRLNVPSDPRTGKTSARFLWRALRRWPVMLLVLGLAAILPVLLFLLESITQLDLYRSPLLRWPAYANLTEMASPEFAGQGWMIPLALLGWAASAIFAEEALFRGVLLPRMRAAFGRGDWAVNGLLFALYGLFQYWLIPFRLIVGLILARQARRWSSTWMAVAIRCAEGLAVAGLAALGVIARPLTTAPVPQTLPYIQRRPVPSTFALGALAKVPTYNPGSGNTFQVDLRGADLSALDLGESGPDLEYADFDTRTVWPPAERMPEGFNPAQIMELGKNPGLGLRALHAQGITGRGVGVAIIDQQLLTEHVEYADRLRWYEEIPGLPLAEAQMHGPAVASLAVGQTVGAAPGADLYFIGGGGSSLGSLFSLGHDYAQAIRRVLQINRSLPGGQKIRVISISSGWMPFLGGYQDVRRAIRDAEAEGLMVINVDAATGLAGKAMLNMAGRPIQSDPDDFASYRPAVMWERWYFASGPANGLWIPVDSRTYASPDGPRSYAFGRIGGASWLPPYAAGVYALAAQVDPGITPEQFWAAALRTGKTISFEHNGSRYSLDTILDPAALIEEIQGGE